jgi:hypothetical protein
MLMGMVKQQSTFIIQRLSIISSDWVINSLSYAYWEEILPSLPHVLQTFWMGWKNRTFCEYLHFFLHFIRLSNMRKGIENCNTAVRYLRIIVQVPNHYRFVRTSERNQVFCEHNGSLKALLNLI